MNKPMLFFSQCTYCWTSMREKSMRTPHTACAIVLVLWTALLSQQLLRTFVDRSQGKTSICQAHARALRAVTRHIHAIRDSSATEVDLRTAPLLPSSPSSMERHRRLREASSNLQKLNVRSAHCTTSQPSYRAFEWSLASRYPLDGVLLYLFSVIGTSSRMAVELDDGSGSGVYASAAALSVLHGWDVMALCGSWSGSSFVRTLYADRPRLIGDRFPESFVDIIETRIRAREMLDLLSGRGIVGEIDLLLMFVENGQEKNVFDALDTIRPRVVVATYRDFLGPAAALLRIANATEMANIHPRGGRDPLRPIPYAGLSVAMLNQVAISNAYRLVWCLSMFPVAVFVDERETDSKLFLPSLGSRECFGKRYADRSFRRDMEALWHVTLAEQWG